MNLCHSLHLCVCAWPRSCGLHDQLASRRRWKSLPLSPATGFSVLDGSFRQILICVWAFFSYHSDDFKSSSTIWWLQSAGFPSSYVRLRQVIDCEIPAGFALRLPDLRKRASDSANASSAELRMRVLLQRLRRVHTTPPCQPMNRFFGAREVRLYHLHDLPVQSCATAWRSLLQMFARTLALILFKDSFGPDACHFFAVAGSTLFQLRLAIRLALLLRVLELGRMLFEPLARLPGSVSADSSRCVCVLQRIPQRCYSAALPLYSTAAGFGGLPWRDAPSRPATESSTARRARSIRPRGDPALFPRAYFRPPPPPRLH